MDITKEMVFKFELTEQEKVAFNLVDNVLRLVQISIEDAEYGVVDPEDGQTIDEHDVGRARGVMDTVMNVREWRTV